MLNNNNKLPPLQIVGFKIDSHSGDFFPPFKEVLAITRGQFTSTDGLEMCHSASFIPLQFMASIEIARGTFPQ